MSSDAIIGLYQRHAAAWAKDRGQRLFEQTWLDRFRASFAPGADVLDIGCGSGDPIARYFIERGYAVTGVDSAPAMIEICAAKFPAQTWRVADMRSLSLGTRFAGILAWDSFFHLCPDDQRRMFPIFRGLAAPQGRLMFTSGPAYGEAFGKFHNEPLYHASLDSAEYEALLDAEGFDVVAHVVEDPDCGGHTVWVAEAR